MKNISKNEIMMIQNCLNHRPRKALGYKTPFEVFMSEISRKMVAIIQASLKMHLYLLYKR